MGKKNNKAPKKETVAKKPEAAVKAAPKQVNPVLSWGLILGEIIVAAAVAAAIILPLM